MDIIMTLTKEIYLPNMVWGMDVMCWRAVAYHGRNLNIAEYL